MLLKAAAHQRCCGQQAGIAGQGGTRALTAKGLPTIVRILAGHQPLIQLIVSRMLATQKLCAQESVHPCQLGSHVVRLLSTAFTVCAGSFEAKSPARMKPASLRILWHCKQLETTAAYKFASLMTIDSIATAGLNTAPLCQQLSTEAVMLNFRIVASSTRRPDFTSVGGIHAAGN